MKTDELTLTTHTPQALPVGTVLRVGSIAECIGGGTTGHVYRVLDERGGSVAVREYFPAALAVRTENTVRPRAPLEAAFEAGRKLFDEDGWQLSVQDHPGLLKVQQVWSERGTSYLSMPWCEGRTLDQTVRASPTPPSQAQLEDWVRAMVDALTPVHRRRGVHGNLSPAKVMRLDSGRLLLMEFSRARRFVPPDPRDFERDPYAALECGATERLGPMGPWTDIYAIAAILYFALRGRAPQSPVRRLAYDACEPLAPQLVGDYSEPFLRGIDRGLALRPRARPRNLPAFMAHLGLHERRARPRAAGVSPWAHAAGPDAGVPHVDAMAGDTAPELAADIELDEMIATAAEPAVAQPGAAEVADPFNTHEVAEPAPVAAAPTEAHIETLSQPRPRMGRARAGWAGLGMATAVSLAALAWLNFPRPAQEPPAIALAPPVAPPRATPELAASSPIPDPLEPTAAGPAPAVPADPPASAAPAEESASSPAEAILSPSPKETANQVSKRQPTAPDATPDAAPAQEAIEGAGESAVSSSPCPGLLARQYIGRPLDDAERDQLRRLCR